MTVYRCDYCGKITTMNHHWHKDESEKIFSAKTSYNDLFPETIKRENVAESQ